MKKTPLWCLFLYWGVFFFIGVSFSFSSLKKSGRKLIRRGKFHHMDMTDLYQEKILAFARTARASTLLSAPMATAEIKNPTCGDRVRVDLNYNEDGIIIMIGAHSEGCALCEAGTGLLLSLAEGRHSDDILPMAEQLRTWLAHDHENLLTADQDAFIPAREFTARHQCITLSFEVAAKAIRNT